MGYNFPWQYSAFLKIVSTTGTHKRTIFGTTVREVVKIMSAHAVDKYWMRAVDEKQVISL